MKTCFVITGYGIKKDPYTGRELNLDKSFKNIIKRAFEAKGYSCNRAIDLNVSGSIDKLMFEQIISADIVVVDLSTFNPNVMYELGVRHALRPYSTILLCESESMKNIPFNINHLVIHQYVHMGSGIDFEETEKQKEKLERIIDDLENKNVQDSQIYDFLPGLKVEYDRPVQMVKAKAQSEIGQRSLAQLIEEGEISLKKAEYEDAKSLFAEALSMDPHDDYLIQRLALSTYKSKTPSERESLDEAKKILDRLNIHVQTDSESMGLIGSINKRLYQLTDNEEYLDESIKFYKKGYYMNDDYYTGVNYAAVSEIKANRADNSNQKIKLAQQILQVRTEVGELVEKELQQENISAEEKGWLYLTKAEVAMDLGDATFMNQLVSRPTDYALNEHQIQSAKEQMEMKKGEL